MDNKKFESAKILIDKLWFTEGMVDTEKQSIDWSGIEKNMNEIVPSSIEEYFYKFAQEIYKETGFCSRIGFLDQSHKKALLDSIKILLL